MIFFFLPLGREKYVLINLCLSVALHGGRYFHLLSFINIYPKMMDTSRINKMHAFSFISYFLEDKNQNCFTGILRQFVISPVIDQWEEMMCQGVHSYLTSIRIVTEVHKKWE